MNKIASLILPLLLLSVVSFGQQVKNNIKANGSDEDFSAMQNQFFSDSVFQASRIQFPLEYLRPDAAPRHMTSQDWKFRDHLYYTGNPPEYHSRLIETVKEFNFMRVYGQTDTRYYENYYFSLIDGKWYLVKCQIPGLL